MANWKRTQAMKTIETEPNQTLFDVAVQHYGTLEALAELLELNPVLENDPEALVANGINTLEDVVFRMDLALKPGLLLRVDDESKTMDSKTVAKIDNPVTTYQTWQEQSSRYRTR